VFEDFLAGMLLTDWFEREGPEDGVDGHEHGLSEDPRHVDIAVFDLVSMHVDI